MCEEPIVLGRAAAHAVEGHDYVRAAALPQDGTVFAVVGHRSLN